MESAISVAKNLIKKYGSPCYIYNSFTIQNKIQDLLEAVRKFPTKTKALYACKANTNLHLMKLIKNYGI